jgi:GDP-D-mannose dehydratase
MQSLTPDDYVLATGEGHTVREFVEAAFAVVRRSIGWRGTGRTRQLTGPPNIEIPFQNRFKVFNLGLELAFQPMTE